MLPIGCHDQVATTLQSCTHPPPFLSLLSSIAAADSLLGVLCMTSKGECGLEHCA